MLEVDDYQLRPRGGRYEVVISNTCSLPLDVLDREGMRELEEHYSITNESCTCVVMV